eukprot:TRINITY_DN781900_c0_g1_i1.p1 TRINITY_DN781900_c0_g1~~TRINITY_DN781900_c0_g1_i1.p1  ORF type:complete len:373 (+),score=104.88 TRINITY_DN781900_c0_g1_i1:56-1174(+)
MSTEIEKEELPILSLDLLIFTRLAQNSHGLRRNDYNRYRKYCSNRLETLRGRKDIRMKHGKRQFVAKELTIESVTNDGFLHLALFQTERAWANAMELKALAMEDDQHGPSKLHHAIRKLSKAVKFAKKLTEICTERCNERTVVEALAYENFMSASLAMEKERWEDALKFYSIAHKAYSLLDIVPASDKTLKTEINFYEQRLEEIKPSLRFCDFNIKRDCVDVEDIHAHIASLKVIPEEISAVFNALTEVKDEYVIDAETEVTGVKMSSGLNLQSEVCPLSATHTPLLDNPLSFNAHPSKSEATNVYALPPQMKVLTCKPSCFDLASSFVKFPNVRDRVKQMTQPPVEEKKATEESPKPEQEGGWFSSWFKRS